MKLPAHLYLDTLGIPYQALAFPATLDKGAANVAEALGYRARQMVKTLIFETRAGEQVMVMLGGDQTAVSGLLKKAVGSKDVRMASAETIRTLTGYEVGSVPPFHWQPEGFRSFLEASLLEEPILGVGAGQWGHEILIAPAALQRASMAAVANLSDRTRPVYPEDH